MLNIVTFCISGTVEDFGYIKDVADKFEMVVPTTFSETMVIVLQFIC